MVNSVGSEFYLQLSNKPPITRTSRCITWLIWIAAAMTGNTALAGDSKLPCETTLTANVVAIDHPMVFNRLGAQNVNWMMYALRRDLVHNSSSPDAKISPVKPGDVLIPGKVALRPDLRPRPIVLRVAAGQCLRVRLQNLLTPPTPTWTGANPFDATKVELLRKTCSTEQKQNDPVQCSEHPMEARSHAMSSQIDDQVASRRVGFHPQGLELIGSITSDSSNVGKNDSSLAAPGESKEYLFYAPHEGAFLVSNDGTVFGSEGTAGNSGLGLFGMVAVEPVGAHFYRSQVTEEELRLAADDQESPLGQPIVDYQKKYPNSEPWISEGKAGQPILAMVQNNEIVHSDINAIIAGPDPDGSWKSRCPDPTGSKKCPYPLESQGKRNPTLPNRLEPFREFASIFHDENAAAQAFPSFYSHSVLKYTLHGVRDAFMINYGSGGVGAEVIANRLGVGPMHDCVDCAYEEFFLASSAVGDPAMIVDKPANLGLEDLPPPKPGEDLPERYLPYVGPKATEAFYPHDPANVHHSYIGDFVKFRNVHTGKEQHIFHLHNHQWLFNPNDDNSNYIDAQGIAPGSGYTYEIAFGGSGNRNKSAGDAIFHCHLYPHFAQGMWYLWRIHDVYESGTHLAVSGPDGKGFHQNPFDLKSGKPAAYSRALPDGELAAGVPIPAVVPLPGKAMPLMPGKVYVAESPIKKEVQRYENSQLVKKFIPIGSVAKFDQLDIDTAEIHPLNPKGLRNPGYPFWIAGVGMDEGVASASVGSRPPTPPLDMKQEADPTQGGWNGGLPRHAVLGKSQGSEIDKNKTVLTRLSAAKVIHQAKPVYFDELGTRMEKVAMAFHARRNHDSFIHPMNATSQPTSAPFVTNGAPPVPGAPFHEPCMDDNGDLLDRDAQEEAKYFTKDINGIPGHLPSNRSPYDARHPRIYKGANIQMDVEFNKVGYHYPQQRFLTLWEDVAPTLEKERPPEPFVMRMNTFDCAKYLHTNLVPEKFVGDDYQITTPTDVIGQHIHLPKWDLSSADGSANGWNYEDATLSPGTVRERIAAINLYNKNHQDAAVHPRNDQGNPIAAPLVPEPHPYFGKLHDHQYDDCKEKWIELAEKTKFEGLVDEFDKKYVHPGQCDWLGARTTIQRWFSDPVVNVESIHRGLGTTFTHDHLGPSTHQQVGLYATMLSEPPNSAWYHNETNELLYCAPETKQFCAPNQKVRTDGGPTSWQARITGQNKSTIEFDGDRTTEDSHREFFLQFGDFQHAYTKEYSGLDDKGNPLSQINEHTHEATDLAKTSFRYAINPGYRKPDAEHPTDVVFEDKCPGGATRPCPEAISADDVGMMVVNYRNEPVGLRVFDPETKQQTTGRAGDLAFALQSRTDRAIGELNTVEGTTDYPPLTKGLQKGDPFTPMLRVYSGDTVRVKLQAGSHEHEHNASINGLTWLQAGSGYGKAPNSGWRGSQNAGLSEQFTLTAPITDYDGPITDRLYTMDSSQDGMWSGVWGTLRSYSQKRDAKRDRLDPLPGHNKPRLLVPAEGNNPLRECPQGAPQTTQRIVAVLANKVLGNAVGAHWRDGHNLKDSKGGTLVYNNRPTNIAQVQEKDPETGVTETIGTMGASGPLHDPTAILFVRAEDLDADGKLKPDAPVEPLVLRMNANECLVVELENRLEKKMPDLDGYVSLTPIVTRSKPEEPGSMKLFGNNQIRPSAHIGLHPQLVSYGVRAFDGNNVGLNPPSTVAPGESRVYRWYAGMFDTASCTDEVRDAPPYQRLKEFRKAIGKRALTKLKTLRKVEDRADKLIRQEFGELAGDENLVQSLKQDVVATLKQADCLQDENEEIKQDRLSTFEKRVNCSTRQKVADLKGKLRDRLQQLKDDKPRLDKLHRAVHGAWYRMSRSDNPDDQADEIAQDVDKQVLEKLAEDLRNVDTDEPDDPVDVDKGATQPEGEQPEAFGSDTTSLVRLGDETAASRSGNEQCRIRAVEFGGSNLTPPDRIKQGQKGAIGALVVLPPGSTVQESDLREDHQAIFAGETSVPKRRTRLSATVTYEKSEVDKLSGGSFRDYAVIHQKALNLRYKNGEPVGSLAAEREAGQAVSAVPPEDSHDAGQMAINYGTEPMWFRLGIPPESAFGNGGTRGRDPVGLGGLSNAWQVFSNLCCNPDPFLTDVQGNPVSPTLHTGDPATGVFEVPAGMQTRLHVLEPTGVGRATVFELHGHPWPRDPYLAEKRDVHGFPIDDGGLGSIRVGPNASVDGQHNPMQFWLGGQESVTPQAHFDVILSSAGGRYGVPGDYLFRDHAGFGITNGLWGIMRVTGSSEAGDRRYQETKPTKPRKTKKRKADKLALLD